MEVDILIVSHVVPYPPAHGIQIRIYKMLQWLRSEGFSVGLVVAPAVDSETEAALREVVDELFWLPSPEPSSLPQNASWARGGLRSAFTQVRKAIAVGVRSSLGRAEPVPRKEDPRAREKWLCPPELIALVHRAVAQCSPRAVLIQGIFLTDCFAALNRRILRIIDTHDMFSRRLENVTRYNLPEPIQYNAEEERVRLLRCDIVLAIQEVEARLFRALVPEREVLCIGIDFPVQGGAPSRVVPDSIAVVGSDNPANAHGLDLFLTRCWPAIKQRRPTAVLKVYGRVARTLKRRMPAVEAIGWISSLGEAYERCAVVINPTIAGTGLKIKSVEALAYGKPLVAWENAVEGLESEGESPFIACESPSAFADAVIGLLEDPGRAKALGQLALRYAAIRFERDNVYKPLRQLLCQHFSRSAPSQNELTNFNAVG
ncbi:MAG: glycosyltransferase [Bryobacteraceae bacterium]